MLLIQRMKFCSILGQFSKFLPAGLTAATTQIPNSSFTTSSAGVDSTKKKKKKIQSGGLPNCAKKTSFCEKSESTCRMPLMEVDEHHESAKKYFRKVGRQPKRDIWIPLDYIHRIDEEKPRTEFQKTWKECPRIVVRKVICTAEEIICPEKENETARFGNDANETQLPSTIGVKKKKITMISRGMCSDMENKNENNNKNVKK